MCCVPDMPHKGACDASCSTMQAFCSDALVAAGSYTAHVILNSSTPRALDEGVCACVDVQGPPCIDAPKPPYGTAPGLTRRLPFHTNAGSRGLATALAWLRALRARWGHLQSAPWAFRELFWLPAVEHCRPGHLLVLP